MKIDAQIELKNELELGTDVLAMTNDAPNFVPGEFRKVLNASKLSFKTKFGIHELLNIQTGTYAITKNGKRIGVMVVESGKGDKLYIYRADVEKRVVKQRVVKPMVNEKKVEPVQEKKEEQATAILEPSKAKPSTPSKKERKKKKSRKGK